ncbi:MAG: glycosyltransferase family 9 protein [Thermoanaerobaculia bacterium]
MRVLIVRLSAMGDIVHALPLAAGAAGAGHRVGWVVERPFASLLRDNPNVHELIVADSKKIRRRFFSPVGIGALRSLRASMRAFAADVILDPQGNEKSFWVSRLGAAPRLVLDDTRFRRNWTRRFSALRVEPPVSARHVCEKTISLLRAIGVAAASPAPDARYLLGASDRAAEEFLRLVPRPFALYHPGAGWRDKAWGEDRFAALASAVRDELGIHPVVSWGPGDETRSEELARKSGASRIPALDFPGLAKVIAGASFFAAGDTGPLHLADALGVRTVGLYGPTSPARTGPFRKNGPVFFSGLPCSPCNARFPETKRCLREISPSAVLSALDRRELAT